mgnify:CR=1 FL=1
MKYFAVEQFAAFLFVGAAPLFEKEWNIVVMSLLLQRLDPFLADRAGAGAGFTADNDPVHAAKVGLYDL